ncbi:MAG TPA: hypothetical protein VMO52_08165 [Acidimicrobiia bacterium]|nr:hypothetical protein [Acidimicrobiia bacterium]
MPVPSVLLHDHLDGGLRSGTLIDLARASKRLTSEVWLKRIVPGFELAGGHLEGDAE